MDVDTLRMMVELRLIVGFLGEKSQSNWWGSSFVETNSEAFLSPVFSRTTMLARYHGVCEAAMLVHDEHIGLGANYHLYRMPDSIERAAVIALSDTEFQQQLRDVLESSVSAQTRLGEVTTTGVSRVEGPVGLGIFADADLDQQLSQYASHYSRAFEEGYKCFPFVRETK